MEETSNLNAPVTPSMSDVDDGEEVVSTIIVTIILFTGCYTFLFVMV